MYHRGCGQNTQRADVVGAALSQNKATVVFSPPLALALHTVIRKQDLIVGPKPLNHPPTHPSTHLASSSLFWKQWCLSQTWPDPHIPAWSIKVCIVQLNGLHRYCRHCFHPFSHCNHNVITVCVRTHTCFSQYTPRGFLGACCCFSLDFNTFRIIKINILYSSNLKIPHTYMLYLDLCHIFKIYRLWRWCVYYFYTVLN